MNPRVPSDIEDTSLGWSVVFLLLGVVLLPVDYFLPSAEILREAGAKPSIIAFALAAILSWASRMSDGRPLSAAAMGKLWLILLWSGALAFGLNQMFGWSQSTIEKSPAAQFAAQGALLVLFVGVTLEFSDMLRVKRTRDLVIRVFILTTFINLIFFILEGAGILLDYPGTFLGLFRAEEGIIERPTGLMSEPSYFGAFAGLFGFIFLVHSWRSWLIRLAVPLVLFGGALWINARTFLIVIGLQVIGLLWLKRREIPLIVHITVVSLLLGASIPYITTTATFDLYDNLSSAMRFGSSLLGINVALDGYGWLGVGTGQFHFFYRLDYAPDVLLKSQEALNQMDPNAPSRASTYNILVRFLVEGGVASLAIFSFIVVRALKNAAENGGEDGKFAYLLILGSIGFLLSQDTYFYPPLCLGLAFAFALSPSHQSPEGWGRNPHNAL